MASFPVNDFTELGAWMMEVK